MTVIIDTALGLLKEGVALWRTYLEKKSELYDLHLKKRRKKALEIAEEAFDIAREIFAFVHERIPMNDDNWKDYYKLKEKFYKYNRKFDKYD